MSFTISYIYNLYYIKIDFCIKVLLFLVNIANSSHCNVFLLGYLTEYLTKFTVYIYISHMYLGYYLCCFFHLETNNTFSNINEMNN